GCETVAAGANRADGARGLDRRRPVRGRGNDVLRREVVPRHSLTKRRMSTFRISPMASRNMTVDDPPYDSSGSGMPVVGSRPICIDTLMTTWKTTNEMR